MTEKYVEILKSNGITDPVSEVIIKDAGLQGEGFASITKCVTVKFEDLEKKPLNLFVKLQPGNKSSTEVVDEMKSFEKEARFLTDYLRAAQEICELKDLPEFIDFYPKCYYGDENMIVLENLVLDKGYQLLNKEEGQTLEAAKCAIKTIAKHNALGHVMIIEAGGPEKFFQKYPNLDFEAFDKPYMVDMMESTFNNCINSNIKILEKNDVVGAQETIQKLKNYSENQPPIKTVLDALKISQDKQPSFLVLGHGDYWNNNMMVQMDKNTNKIIHHVAIDFQVTRYNSPSLDLLYYLFSSVQPHVRRSHLLELLTLYKDTVNKAMEDLGHPTYLTLDQVFRDYRERVGYGFWFGFEMSIGPGMSIYKDIDVSNTDTKDWPALVNQLINKWIDDNPEKGEETAKDIVNLVREYEQLRL